ncbi:MAG: hypothetical protein GF350_02040 [Chitinivibrionales bacterium]|nr:hypothetical protein [Chitinivibrionales bacterium]
MDDPWEIIRKEKGIPRKGEYVKSKRFGTQWKVIVEKEGYVNVDDNPVTRDPRMVPAITLTYWKEEPGVKEGEGKTMTFDYTRYDTTFELHWDSVNKD